MDQQDVIHKALDAFLVKENLSESLERLECFYTCVGFKKKQSLAF